MEMGHSFVIFWVVIILTILSVQSEEEEGSIVRKTFRKKVKIDEERDTVIVQKAKEDYEERSRLVQYLLDSYNSMMPDTDSIRIEFGISLSFIVDVSSNIIITNLQIHLKWQDHRLKWDPTSFGNIEKLAIFPHRIWRPSLLHKNSIDEQFDPTFPTSATVHDDGVINYNPPGIFKSFCEITPEDFPFDYQSCTLRFGFMHDEGVGNVEFMFIPSATELVLKNYEKSPIWDIVNITTGKSTKSYTGVDVPLEELTFTFTLRRKPLYYLWTYVLHLLILTFILPFIFLIPIGSKERIICSLLLLEIFPGLLRFYSSNYGIPVSYDVIPIFGKYSIMVNILGIFIIIESIIQLFIVDCKNNCGNTNHDSKNKNQHQQQWKIPRTFDLILFGLYYVIILSMTILVIVRLPWMWDYRPHF